MPVITPDFGYELSLVPPGTRFLLGIDEVGRGPLAGPVTIGAFLLDLSTFDPEVFIKLGVRDSKLISPVKRQKINTSFVSLGFSFATYSLSSEDIDRQGIGVAIRSLISSALEHYRTKAQFCLIDGNYSLTHPRVRSVIKADTSCFSVAAASIVAKVDRDAQMDTYHQTYPNYGFAAHKGYGTKAHLAALTTHGPCPIHRRSFRPVRVLCP
ncbi:MAG: ribonuclease HII [Candidatus Shapirobacteria bacterium]